jgi:anti-sigma factor RsiW
MEDRLNDFVGGYLSGAERREVEEHLLACPACRQEAEALRDLVHEVGDMPKEISPPPDLWPEMVATIEQRKAEGVRLFERPGALRAWWPSSAMAAAAALVMVAGAVIALTMGPFPPDGGPAMQTATGPGAPPTSRIDAVAAATVGLMPDVLAAEVEFNRASEALLAVLESRRADLPPGAYQVIDENLRIINEALAEVRAALDDDPSNPRLGVLVTAIYRQKLSLLREAAGLPTPI